MTIAYLSEKQLKKRKRLLKFKIYGIFIVFCVLIIGILYFIVYSPVLNNVEIKIISGEQKVVDDFKIFLLSQSKLALILGSDNIISWTGNVGIEKFLGENPSIDDLQIKKDYLLRQINFEIKKREKFGIWCVIECWWFDKNGKIFEKAPRIEGEMIYKINDYSNRQLAIGSQIIEENLFENLLKIFEAINKAGLNVKTLYLRDLVLQEVSVESSGLPKIYFSLRFDPSFALSAIEKLKKEGIFKKINYIDFRVENRVYYNL